MPLKVLVESLESIWFRSDAESRLDVFFSKQLFFDPKMDFDGFPAMRITYKPPNINPYIHISCFIYNSHTPVTINAQTSFGGHHPLPEVGTTATKMAKLFSQAGHARNTLRIIY